MAPVINRQDADVVSANTSVKLFCDVDHLIEVENCPGLHIHLAQHICFCSVHMQGYLLQLSWKGRELVSGVSVYSQAVDCSLNFSSAKGIFCNRDIWIPTSSSVLLEKHCEMVLCEEYFLFTQC